MIAGTYVRTYVRKYKVSYPEGAAAAEMATATADDVYVHRIQCCIHWLMVVCGIWNCLLAATMDSCLATLPPASFEAWCTDAASCVVHVADLIVLLSSYQAVAVSPS